MDNITYSCETCFKVDEECSKEQIRACLGKAKCAHCESTSYGYPYGRDESRHCNVCGAEWAVYK